MLRQVAPRSMIPWLPRETYNVRTALPFVTSIGHDHSAEALRDQVETLLRPRADLWGLMSTATILSSRGDFSENDQSLSMTSFTKPNPGADGR